MLNDYPGKILAIGYGTDLSIGDSKSCAFQLFEEDSGSSLSNLEKCKETFCTKNREIILNEAKWHTKILGVSMGKDAQEKAAWLVNEFEKKFLKLEKPSEFYRVQENEKWLVIKVSRKWYRNPTSFHMLLTLIRISEKVDMEKTIEENFNIIIKLNGTDHQYEHFCKGKSIFQTVMTKGFDFVFRKEKEYKTLWFKDGGWFGGSHHAIAYFYDSQSTYLNFWRLFPISINWNQLEEKYISHRNIFKYMTDEYFESIFPRMKKPGAIVFPSPSFEKEM